MVDQWNPNNPAVAGLEWFAADVQALALGTTLVRGAKVPSTTAESIKAINAYIDALVASTAGGYVPVCVDIYDDSAALFAHDSQSVVTIPSGNGSNDPGTGAFGLVTGLSLAGYLATDVTAYDGTAHNNCDVLYVDSDPMPDATTAVDFIRFTPNAATPTDPAWLTMRFATAMKSSVDGTTTVSMSSPPQRITNIAIDVIVANQHTPRAASVKGVLLIGGNNYYSAPQTVAAGTPWQKIRFSFPFNPATGRQWCRADLTALLSGGTDSAGLWVQAGGSGPFLVNSIMLRAIVNTETRLATGYGNAALAATNGWTPLALVSVQDNVTPTNWAKASATTYDLLFSLTGFGGQAAVRCPNSNVTGVGPTGGRNAPNGWVGITAAADRSRPNVDTPDTYGWVPGTYMTLASAGLAVDAQPYVALVSSPVDATHSPKQRLNNPGALTYQVVSFLAQLTPNAQGGVTQDAPLTVELRKTSDDSLLAGPLTVQTADVAADGKWHRVQAQWAAGALLTLNEAVYVIFKSAATVAWHVAGLRTYQTGETGTFPDTAALRSYGGTSAYGLADTDLDLPVTIAPSPAAPGTLTISEKSTPNALATTGGAQVGTISVAHLAWAVTSLGGSFAFYEIQRQETDPLLGSAIWADIAYITSESHHAFDDLEMRRSVDKGVSTLYRIRVVRTDGIASPWANFAALKVSAQPCGVYLVSNFAPTMPVAFYDNTPSDMSWPEMADVKLVKFLGRDFRVQFKPTERLGDAFTRRITVASNDPAVADTTTAAYRKGRPVFEPVLASVRASTAPYLVWADAHGNRWFSSVVIVRGDEIEPAGSYHLDMTVEQITALPFPVTTAAPWLA